MNALLGGFTDELVKLAVERPGGVQAAKPLAPPKGPTPPKPLAVAKPMQAATPIGPPRVQAPPTVAQKTLPKPRLPRATLTAKNLRMPKPYTRPTLTG